MADLLVLGAGVVGLGTALLLAEDGHHVTILERDPQPPPELATDAWAAWERRGVNQFRLPHFFLARWRAILDRELPHVADAIEQAGGLRYNLLLAIPEEIRGPARPEDAQLEVLTGRRPLIESALAEAAARHPGINVRRGVAVSGVLPGKATRAGVLHVGGVHTECGEELSADLVVDMTGRRSPLPRWLIEAGGRPPREVCEDSGFTYYARHYRSADGTIPPVFGPIYQPLGTIGSVTLPADNGSWSVVLVAVAHDQALYRLRDVSRWERVVRSLPRVAHWLDGEPVDERVRTITKIEDRRRDFVVDGQPVATGVVAVADVWACTNPSRGRGVSIGMLHALALRRLLRESGLRDAYQFAQAFHRATADEVEPLFALSRFDSRHRLAEIDAEIRGEVYDPNDRGWELEQALYAAAALDPECLRVAVRTAMLVDPLQPALASDGMIDRVMALGAERRDQQLPAPDRNHLIALANS